MNLTEQQNKDLNDDGNKYNLRTFPACRYKTKSDSWFIECFEDCKASNEAKNAAKRIISVYPGMNGVCDPAYIANIIQEELNEKLEAYK